MTEIQKAEKNEVQEQYKKSMAQSLNDLSDLMNFVEKVEESGGEVPDEAIAVFQNALSDIRNAVDRRIFMNARIENEISLLKMQSDVISRRKKTLENAKDRIRLNTIELMQANPEVEFEGTNERYSLSVTEKEKTKIKLNLGEQRVNRILNSADLEKIPEQFHEKVSFVRLSEDYENLVSNDETIERSKVETKTLRKYAKRISKPKKKKVKESSES